MKWRDVGKAIGKTAPLIGGLLTGGTTTMVSAAGAMLASALGVEPEPDQIHAALKADPEALAKVRQAEIENGARLSIATMENETARISEVNQTMRVEATSGKWWQSAWRPYWGFISGTSFGFQMAAVSITIIKDPAAAPAVIAAIAALTGLWGIALSVLGVAVWKRSDDKAAAAGQSAGPGIFNAIAQRIAPGGGGK